MAGANELRIEFDPVGIKNHIRRADAGLYRNGEVRLGPAARVRPFSTNTSSSGTLGRHQRALHVTIIPAVAFHAVIEIIPLPANFTTISPTAEGREETAADGRHLAAIRIASNDMIQTIAGRAAPELTVPYWIDADGKERPPITLEG